MSVRNCKRCTCYWFVFTVSQLVVTVGRASFEQRLIGLEQALPNMTMDRLEWFSSIGDDDKRAQAFQKLIGCPYDVIQLAGAPPLALILESMQLNGCDFRSTVVGAFDTDDVVYEALSSDRLAFTITQQPHLQGAFVVMMSVLYATTGQKLASPIESKDGVYLAGPLLLTKDNVLSHTQQTCEEEGYPICPNKLALDGSVAQCACTNRRNIVLAGVTHGLTTDGFWDAVYAGMDQAALDYDVQLLAVRMDPKNDTDTLLVEMVQQIREVCRQNIDGLFVSIPNTVVEDVIEECQTLGVPIVSINTGAEASERLGLLEHIGQLEWRAGMSAGERLIEAGARRGVCLIDESFNAGQVDRCLGMEQAFQDSEEQVEFMGSHVVPYNNPGEYQNIVEGILGKEGSWDDIAILPTGLRQLDSVLALQADHYGLITGVFDLNERVYDLLDNGKVRFAIDQNAYLQGYLPVPLLAFKAYTGQSLVNKFVESGPDFVLSSPSKEKVACQEILFQACPMDADGPLVVDENARLSPGAIGGIIVCVMLATAFVVYAAIRLHQLSARLDKRKEKGEDVPRLSLRRRLRVLVKPVDTVVLSTRRRCSPTEFLAKEPSHDSPSPDVAVIDCSTATTREAGDMEEAMDDDISDLPRTRYMIKGNSSLNCAFYDNEVSEDET